MIFTFKTLINHQTTNLLCILTSFFLNKQYIIFYKNVHLTIFLLLYTWIWYKKKQQACRNFSAISLPSYCAWIFKKAIYILYKLFKINWQNTTWKTFSCTWILKKIRIPNNQYLLNPLEVIQDYFISFWNYDKKYTVSIILN